MLKRRIFKSIITVIMVAGLAAMSGLLTAGAGYAATTAQAHAVARSAPAVPFTPTSVRCTTPGHANPCWATTQNAHDGGPYGCSYPHGVPLFLRRGGVHCLGGNDLVEISCYYHGSPTVHGDNYQDHVIAEDAGRTRLTGHIPDFFVNLDHHNPPAVHIHPC
jgi:hypothetical protein